MSSPYLPRLTRCLCGSGNQVESLAAEIYAEFGCKALTDEAMFEMTDWYTKQQEEENGRQKRAV